MKAETIFFKDFGRYFTFFRDPSRLDENVFDIIGHGETEADSLRLALENSLSSYIHLESSIEEIGRIISFNESCDTKEEFSINKARFDDIYSMFYDPETNEYELGAQ